MQIDHFVLTVRDIEATVHFYCDGLGMRRITFGEGRVALGLGRQKINLHPAGGEYLPHARMPTPGSGDFCLLVEEPVEALAHRLKALGLVVVEGPVMRTGADGPIRSIYLYDPDGNLVELANPVGD
jgi:catechol 2,3-dioxygenase-like lactoylglutathione lyase family enzyme